MPGSASIGYSAPNRLSTVDVNEKEIAAKVKEKSLKDVGCLSQRSRGGGHQGTLIIMVGGEKEVFEDCPDILQVMGEKIVHVEGIGMGQVVKACNQITVGLTLQAVSEALVLGTKAVVDPQLMIEAISGGVARFQVLEKRAPWMLERRFKPGFKSSYQHKDVGFALDAGKEFGVSLPVTSLAHEMFGAFGASSIYTLAYPMQALVDWTPLANAPIYRSDLL